MKKPIGKKFIGVLCLLIVLCLSATVVACAPKTKAPTVGTISGLLTDDEGIAIKAVTLKIGDTSTVSDDSGKYTFKDITIGDVTISVDLEGYNPFTANVVAADFAKGVCVKNITLAAIKGSVKGKVSGPTSTSPLAGVTVRMADKSTTTAADGTFEIANTKILGTKSVKFTKDGYEDTTKSITIKSFILDSVNNTYATKTNFTMAENDIEGLPTLKPYMVAEQAVDENKLFIHNSKEVNIVDSFGTGGKVESHNEGICLLSNIKSNEVQEVMESFIYNKFLIDSSTNQLSVKVRSFIGQNDDDAGGPFIANLMLWVIKSDKTVVKFDKTYPATPEVWVDAIFDLSEYAGETITVVLGTSNGFHAPVSQISLESKSSSTKTIALSGEADAPTATIKIYDAIKEDSFVGNYQLASNWRSFGKTSVGSEGIFINPDEKFDYKKYEAAVATDITNGNTLAVDAWEKELAKNPILGFIYANKAITETNNSLKLNMRTFLEQLGGSDANGDLNKYNPYMYVWIVYEDDDGKQQIKKFDGERITGNDDAGQVFTYDLSEFNGKEVVVMIGSNVGWKCVVQSINFLDPNAPVDPPVVPEV